MNDILFIVKLLEDPDEEVYRSLSQRILAHGTSAIPLLEKECLEAKSRDHYDRINQLLSELRFRKTLSNLKEWLSADNSDLIDGLLFTNQVLDPDVKIDIILKQIDKIHNEIWLELSNRLTALEKSRIINHILFSKYGFKIKWNKPGKIKTTSLSNLLSEKSGTEDSVFALYSIIARKLGLPIFGVNIPGISLLTYLDLPLTPKPGFEPSNAATFFFIHPAEKGRLYSLEEVRNFIGKIYPEFKNKEIKAYNDKKLVKHYLRHLAMNNRSMGKFEIEGKLKELLNLW